MTRLGSLAELGEHFGVQPSKEHDNVGGVSYEERNEPTNSPAAEINHQDENYNDAAIEPEDLSGEIAPELLSNRDTKVQYGRRGESLSKQSRGTRPVTEEFIGRTATILGIAERNVPELFTAPTVKSIRLSGLNTPSEDGLEQKERLEHEFSTSGIETMQLPWYSRAYTFAAEDTPAVSSLPVIKEGRGLIQNTSSLLPVLALTPVETTRVMDVCASPGGKTSLIADIAEGKAEITANELKAHRLPRLRGLLEQLGVEAEVVNHDGRHLPGIFGERIFEKVLLDAECSTEAGINFDSKKPLEGWSLERVERLSRLQRQLLVASLKLLTTGGTVVYATCTLSPEENERVVSQVLDRNEDTARIVPLYFDSSNAGRGISKWKDEAFPKEVTENVIRITPDDSQAMEGFFVAAIQKINPNEATPKPEPIYINEVSREKGDNLWNKRR